MGRVFCFILTDLYYLLPVIKQFDILHDKSKILFVVCATVLCVISLIINMSKNNTFYNIVPYDISKSIARRWGIVITSYIISIVFYLFWYIITDSVSWTIWWFVTIIFVIHLCYQFGYGIWRIINYRPM